MDWWRRGYRHLHAHLHPLSDVLINDLVENVIFSLPPHLSLSHWVVWRKHKYTFPTRPWGNDRVETVAFVLSIHHSQRHWQLSWKDKTGIVNSTMAWKYYNIDVRGRWRTDWACSTGLDINIPNTSLRCACQIRASTLPSMVLLWYGWLVTVY